MIKAIDICPMCGNNADLTKHHLVNTTLAERIAAEFISSRIAGRSLQKLTHLIRKTAGIVLICRDCHQFLNVIYSSNLNNLRIIQSGVKSPEKKERAKKIYMRRFWKYRITQKPYQSPLPAG